LHSLSCASLIDGFLKWLCNIASEKRKKCIAASLDGQDRDVCADYLVTNSMVFVLIEFKYQEKDIATERLKSLPEELCRKLLEAEEMKKIHQLCHFIAWSIDFNRKMRILFNTFFNEVCNKKALNSSSSDLQQMPLTTERFCESRFADNFFSNKLGVRYEEFERYIDWLLELKSDDRSGGNDKSLEFLLLAGDSDNFILEGFQSLQELKNWLVENDPKNKINYTPDIGGPSL